MYGNLFYGEVVYAGLPLTGTYYTLRISDSITINDNEAKSMGISVAEALSISDTEVKGIGVSLTDTLNITDSILPFVPYGKPMLKVGESSVSLDTEHSKPSANADKPKIVVKID